MFGSTCDFRQRFCAARAPRSQSLNLPHRQSATRCPLRVAHAQLRIRHRQQGATVPRRQFPFFNPILNRRLQFQQANRVRHRRAIFARALRNRFLG